MAILLVGSSGYIGKYIKGLEHICLRDNYSISDLSKFDVVIYLVGLAHKKYSEDEYIETNVNLTLDFANKAVLAGVKRLVYLSSANVQDCLSVTTSLATKSKWLAEQGLKIIAKSSALEVVIVRSPLVYGPDAPGNFGLLAKLVKKSPFLPFGLINNKRDFIALPNLVDLLMLCAKHPNAAGRTFFASDGHAVSIKEFTNSIAKGLNKNIIQLPIPSFLMIFFARLLGKKSISEQLFDDFELDISELQSTLSWVAPYTMKEAMLLLSKLEHN